MLKKFHRVTHNVIKTQNKGKKNLFDMLLGWSETWKKPGRSIFARALGRLILGDGGLQLGSLISYGNVR